MFVWIALGVSVVATVASLAFAAGRGLGTWRVFRGSQDRLSGELDEMNLRVAAMEQRMAAAGEAGVRFERARAELQESLAAAQAIADAAAEVRTVVRLALRLVPTG